MPKCPQCNFEVEDDVKNCPMCQTELTGAERIESNEEALLINAKDEQQANIVAALLKAYEIPIRKKLKGNDTFLNVYMNLTTHGIDIYVPQSRLEQARDIIKNELVEEEADNMEIQQAFESNEDMEELSREYDRKRRRRAWIILLFFTPGIAGVVIAIIYYIILAFMY